MQMRFEVEILIRTGHRINHLNLHDASACVPILTLSVSNHGKLAFLNVSIAFAVWVTPACTQA